MVDIEQKKMKLAKKRSKLALVAVRVCQLVCVLLSMVLNSFIRCACIKLS